MEDTRGLRDPQRYSLYVHKELTCYFFKRYQNALSEIEKFIHERKFRQSKKKNHSWVSDHET